jgi:pyridoxal/pyridoxine/pyridoxamine kinase
MKQQPKRILCIHDLSGIGRCSLSVILPVLCVMGHQPVALPTAVLSTHTGGLGEPARMEDAVYGLGALKHYKQLGLGFDCIYSGYLASPAQAEIVHEAYRLWPGAYKVVDPVLGDHGRRYSGLSEELQAAVEGLCREADLILPNYTEAHLLLHRDVPEAVPDEAAAQTLAADAASLAPAAVVTGIPMGSYIACAGAGREPFLQKNLHLERSFPGTGDLFGALLVGSLARGNALSAAADSAAGFVAEAIRNTAPDADARLGVWFEPLLGRLVPPSAE